MCLVIQISLRTLQWREMPTSQGRIEIVLIQNGHSIAYQSVKLSGKMLLASTYAKEMYAITQAIGK